MNKESQTEDKLDQMEKKKKRPLTLSFKIMIYDNWSHSINGEEIIYYLKVSHDCELYPPL